MGRCNVPFELMTGSTLSGHSELLNTFPPNSDRTPGSGGDSQAQPLHHALPRLRRSGAGIGSCFNLTGEGIAGKDGRSKVSVEAQN